jgi:hydrogenase expression/formation protein HypC
MRSSPQGESNLMCLAIPGKIIEIVDAENHIAKVEVGGVRRNINTGMLDESETQIGNYVLIHVGFAMSRIDEHEAQETLRILEEIGQYEDEFSQFKTTME